MEALGMVHGGRGDSTERPVPTTRTSGVSNTAGHNASPQAGVDINPDPALSYAHEHTHEHIHHGKAAADGKHEILYSKGTTDPKHDLLGTPPQDYEAHKLNEKATERSLSDAENGTDRIGSIHDKENKSDVKIGALYRKFKLPVHIFIWLVWTA